MQKKPMPAHTINGMKSTILGSIWVTMSQISAATAETIAKKSEITVLQILLGRITIHFLVAITWWNIKKPDGTMNWWGDKPDIKNIWIRGLLFSIGSTLYYYGVITLPLGDFQCIFYISPLMTVLFASVLLKEKLPETYILIPSILLTVIGVILVSQPSFVMSMIDIRHEFKSLPFDGVISTILVAFEWSTCALLVRKAVTSHFLQLELAVSVCFFFIGMPITALVNIILDSEYIGSLAVWDINAWHWNTDIMISMLSLGVLGFCTLMFSVKGYQIGEATMVSWLEYIMIPISFMAQTFIFNDTPNIWESVGASLVLIGALLPFIHQVIKYFCGRNKTAYIEVENEGDIYEEQELMRIYSATE
eukprot:490996_1